MAGALQPGTVGAAYELLGDDGWKTDLSRLEKLLPYGEDAGVLKEFREIKDDRRRALAQFLEQRHGIAIDTDTVFDVQIKRIHEYKRQLLNILAVLELYFQIKEETSRISSRRRFCLPESLHRDMRGQSVLLS